MSAALPQSGEDSMHAAEVWGVRLDCDSLENVSNFFVVSRGIRGWLDFSTDFIFSFDDRMGTVSWFIADSCMLMKVIFLK